jgi:hypothetical protein
LPAHRTRVEANAMRQKFIGKMPSLGNQFRPLVTQAQARLALGTGHWQAQGDAKGVGSVLNVRELRHSAT